MVIPVNGNRPEENRFTVYPRHAETFSVFTVIDRTENRVIMEYSTAHVTGARQRADLVCSALNLSLMA